MRLWLHKISWACLFVRKTVVHKRAVRPTNEEAAVPTITSSDSDPYGPQGNAVGVQRPNPRATNQPTNQRLVLGSGERRAASGAGDARLLAFAVSVRPPGTTVILPLYYHDPNPLKLPPHAPLRRRRLHPRSALSPSRTPSLFPRASASPATRARLLLPSRLLPSRLAKEKRTDGDAAVQQEDHPLARCRRRGICP